MGTSLLLHFYNKTPSADIQKNLDRERRIPPVTPGVGARASKLDVSKMSVEDIKKLSAEDAAILAGDVLG